MMTKIIYEIDHAADTVIILKNPLTSFAVWDTLEVREDAEALCPDRETVDSPPIHRTSLGSDDEELTPEKPTLDEPTLDEPTLEESTITEPTVEEPTVDAVEQPVDEQPVDEQPVDEPTVDAVEPLAAGESLFGTTGEPVIEKHACHATPIVEDTVEPDLSRRLATEDEIYYHVSSRHLRLASPRFDSMLTKGKWTEGVPNENDGRYHISAEDWDVEALLLLLNVLHHRNRQVPRILSLEMLAKIAVLIDYYDCAEAVELCTERWTEHIRKASPIPSVVCRDLMLWMCISWVLRMPDEFTQTTAIALRQIDRGLLTLGLPITSCVGTAGSKSAS
jgi:hypothetical protein